MSYTVKVSDVDELSDALKAAWNDKQPAPGRYEVKLTNEATFGGEENSAEATLSIGGSILGPDASRAFGKSGENGSFYVTADEDGVIQPGPIDAKYTLKANLSQWDWHSPNFELHNNVVITDTLPTAASWNLGDTLPVTGLYDNDGTEITEITEITCPSPIADFNADTNVGKFCLDGQTLRVNVGKYHNQSQSTPAFTNAAIEVQAQWNTIDGLETIGGVQDGDRYRIRNTARFDYDSQNYTTPGVDGSILIPDEDGEAVNDASAFAKSAPATISARQNQSVEVPYTFTIDGARTGVPVESTRIVDFVDTRYFDIDEDLSTVEVSGSYPGKTLNEDDFELSYVDGELTIVLSDTGKTKVADPSNGKLEVKLTLTTRVLNGKETIDITNRADLYGEGEDPLYWSSFQSRASSFGAESETRKHIFDTALNDGEWVDLMVPEAALEQTFVYRLQYIGHNGFGGVPITAITDQLPAGLEFVGFVDEADVATGDNAVPGPMNLTGNLVAAFDASNGPQGSITVSQAPGTTFTSGATASVYFAAKIVDVKELVVNDFGNASTTIVPDKPSIDIEKWTAEVDDNGDDSNPEYDGYGELTNDGEYAGDFDDAPGKPLAANTPQTINFTISNDGPEPLVDIVVSDELTGGKGEIADLNCVFPDDSEGTEWAGVFEPATQFECTGTLPELEGGDTHADLATVTGTGQYSGTDVDDGDPWNGYVPVPSVDIEKWSNEGEAPEYDDAGALLNDGFKGDFDQADGKQLTKGMSQQINFTISNDGEEALIDLVVSDELTGGKGEIEGLECVFPDDTVGSEWAGPLEIGEQFECVGTVPGLGFTETHADTATVTAVGLYSGLEDDDTDEWYGKVPAQLVNTGSSQTGLLALLGGGAGLLVVGAGLLMLRRSAKA